MNNLIGANSTPSYKWRRRLIFFASLLILLTVLMALVEVISIVRAQVIINNAIIAAARVGITGQYDTKMFPNLDAAWTPQDGPDHDGIPCPSSANDPAQVTFESHWGMPCDPTSDDDQWLRKDMPRLIAINGAARYVAMSLTLSDEQPDIPGSGLGVQEYANLVQKAQTDSGWLHVWICSSRAFVGIVNSDQPRYSVDINHTENGYAFPRCTVNQSQPGPYNTYGKDQYDAGGDNVNRDTVTLKVFYNYPLITPLGWLLSKVLQRPGFIQIQASQTAVDECFCPARVINLTNVTIVPVTEPSTPAATSTP